MPVAIQFLLSSVLSFPFSLLDAWEAAANARLAVRMKAIAAAGDPASLAELAKRYPDPPPGRNAAELYNAAFEKMDAIENQAERLAGPLPIVGDGQLPDVADALPPAMLARIRRYLAAQAEVLPLLHKAAEREGCKFSLDFDKGMGMLLPHLAKLRQAARLLALEAIERTESGKADDAADSLFACLRAGEALRQEPILVSTLVRIAITTTAANQAERWASRAKPTPAALARLQAAFAAAADARMIDNAMVGERCFGIDAYQTHVLAADRRKMLAALGEGDPPFPLAVNLIPRAYFKMDMCHYLDIMNHYVASARKPYPENFLAGARISRQQLDAKIPRHYVVARVILPALAGVFTAGQQHMARCESARTALAALRYRAKHGRLPAALADMVPEFIPAVPPDPFDGQPIRYRAEAAGLTVYSVGENLKDDAGATEQPPGGKPLDIGFRIRWPKAQF